MIIDIVMPKMGESLTEGTVLEWKKQVGESIERDDPLLEIATDKVDSEIPAPVGGTVVEILGEVNETYEVGVVIARIETSEVVAEGDHQAGKPQQQDPVPSVSPAAPIPAGGPSVDFSTAGRFYSPLVRNIAVRETVSPQELERIPGTGFRGRVTKNDLLFYLETRGQGVQTGHRPDELIATGLAEKVDPAEVEIMEMDNMRKSIARHMRRSLDTSAHVYTVSEADLTGIMDYLDEKGARFKEKHGISLTVTHCIAQALRDALLDYPLVNASLDGPRIIRHKHIHLGIAVAVGEGLVVPPVRNAESMNLLEISAAISGIVRKARERKLKLEDLEGATISITNFGVFGTLAGFPVINQPNVAILGVGAIKKKPIVIETNKGDEIAIRQMGMFTLGFDHRLIDGAMGGRFLEQVMENLEHFDFGKMD